MPTSTGKRVKRAREEAGLTQHGLAKAAGHSRPSVARIEAGHMPTLRLALDVAKALDRTVDDLFGDKPDENNKSPRAAGTAGGVTTSEVPDAVQRA